MPTSGALLAFALETLGGEPSAARLDAEVLLAHALGKPRTRLHGWPEDPVSADQAARYRALVDRRAGGEPVAYLTGMREFWSLPLEVTPQTLIPRPETELAVEVALDRIPAGEPLTVADLGTGTGAIAMAIATERPACRLIATEASPGALAVATRNAVRLALHNVTFRRGHWCDALGGQRCALIVSNPPYVARNDAHLWHGDLRFEPRLALDAGDDGLDALRAIVESAAAHLLTDGALVVEHGHDQGPAVQRLFRQHGYRHVRGYKDLHGMDRVVVGTVA